MQRSSRYIDYLSLFGLAERGREKALSQATPQLHPPYQPLLELHHIQQEHEDHSGSYRKLFGHVPLLIDTRAGSNRQQTAFYGIQSHSH